MKSVPLIWHDDLLVGNEEIDAQHRRLVSSTEKLQRAIASNAVPREVEACCAELLECAREHFTAEEGMMLVAGYPGYEEHRQEHQRLLDQLALIRKTPAAGAAGELILTILSAWTVPHIRFADKNFALFLARANSEAD